MTAPDIEAWQAWEPRGIATVLSGVDVPWYVAGGWAVDLWLGRISRAHEDLEIAVPLTDVVAYADGIPFLRPELALFFKAKHARPKDQQDFDLVAPLLAAADRHRLRSWLTLVHPGHRWLGALSG
ncbi:nucleotidyltransferase domain-containing protein [Hamadaea tsunoensis]|uniref:nucleotidyltransferase domain-containing protein n=1 Tax=Hamadaea tsunoensis TaxID=53368 RepID=UPI000416413E|nr:hypothetical protein [Hamadaea tsunoensis]